MINYVDGLILFTLEKHVDINEFNKLTAGIKNKVTIVNQLEPSVLNNLYNCFQYMLVNYPDEYFTIVDIDDSFNEHYYSNVKRFASILRKQNVLLGRFMGPMLNDKVVNPRRYGYYYSTVFHISIFKYFAPLTFINPIHADNYIVGFALEHSNGMLWSPKYFGYEHIKRANTDSSTVTAKRLEDTLYMYLLNPFSFVSECIPMYPITISVATIPSRTTLLTKMLLTLNNRIAKVIVHCGTEDTKIMELCRMTGHEFRLAVPDNGSFNKIDLNSYEKSGFVLTLDDDYMYDIDILPKLFKSYLLNGRNCVIAGQVRELKSDYYPECPKVSKTDYSVVSVIGGSGVLYPPNFFNDIPEIDRNVFVTCDDMYFSYCARLKRIPIKTCLYKLDNISWQPSVGLYSNAVKNNFTEYSKALQLVKSIQ